MRLESGTLHQDRNQPLGHMTEGPSDQDGGDRMYQDCHPSLGPYVDCDHGGMDRVHDRPGQLPDPSDPHVTSNTNAMEPANASAPGADSSAVRGSHPSPEDSTPCDFEPPSQPTSPVATATSPSKPLSKGVRNRALQGSDRAIPSRRARWTAANGHAALSDMNKLSADSASHMLHGKLVVAAAQEKAGLEGLSQLATRFRQAFVEALHPGFLPPAWEVDHTYANSSSLQYL